MVRRRCEEISISEHRGNTHIYTPELDLMDVKSSHLCHPATNCSVTAVNNNSDAFSVAVQLYPVTD